MYLKYIKNDITKNKSTTILIFLFVLLSSTLVSLSSILIINLTGAMDDLMKNAKTPNVFIMQKELNNNQKLKQFLDQNKDVTDYQVCNFLNIDGINILSGKKTLADSTQDNGFVVANKNFDLLLDLDGKVVRVNDGEISIPVSYYKENFTNIGDIVSVHGIDFVVTNFHRDSVMNSNLVSSKRFLVSQNDYLLLEKFGRPEYIIEFLLNENINYTKFESEYIGAGFEVNGQFVTVPMIKLLNTFAESFMIVILIIISILVVGISFLCIKLTLNAQIQGEYREIGVLKAIGFQISDIKKIYMSKYLFITLFCCILGFVLAFLFKDYFMADIFLFVGELSNQFFAITFGIITVTLFFIIFVLYINKILNQFKKILAVEAINFGFKQDIGKANKFFSLSKLLNKKLNMNKTLNLNLALNDVISDKKLFSTMLIIIIISVFIMIVPQQIYSTMDSEKFVEYMGIGQYDIRIDIQQIDNIKETASDIENIIIDDPLISEYVITTSKMFSSSSDEKDGINQMLKIELGDHSKFPIVYHDGNLPIIENEIALSAGLSNDLHKKVGDSIKILVDKQEKEFIICGLYSDMTYGGRTAKANFNSTSEEVLWSIVGVKLKSKNNIKEFIKTYAKIFPNIKITSVVEYGDSLSASIKSGIKNASYVSIIVAFLVPTLITFLFFKLLVSKDKYKIAILKSLGFSNNDLYSQYILKAIIISILGILLGCVFSKVFGELLFNIIMGSFGVVAITFVTKSINLFIIQLLALTFLIILIVPISVRNLKNIKVYKNLMEE